MQRIGFYLFYTFFWLITWLPLPILYIFSDISYLWVYYIIRYRRDVIVSNLKNSFPEKSDAEIKQLTKKYYHHFCDILFEIQKLMHMPLSTMNKRSRFEGIEIMDEAMKQGRSVTAYMSHYANWEYIPFISSKLDHPSGSIYHPLHNTYMDKFYIKLRGQYGLQLFPMKTAIRNILKMYKEHGRYLMGFISDQAPPRGENMLWIEFLNQDTATFLGAEKIARRNNDLVVYMYMEKIKRGHYVTKVVPISDNPRELPEFELTLRYHKIMEEQIHRQPELWLWSHRRWKRKRPENEKLIKQLKRS